MIMGGNIVLFMVEDGADAPLHNTLSKPLNSRTKDA